MTVFSFNFFPIWNLRPLQNSSEYTKIYEYELIRYYGSVGRAADS